MNPVNKSIVKAVILLIAIVLPCRLAHAQENASSVEKTIEEIYETQGFKVNIPDGFKAEPIKWASLTERKKHPDRYISKLLDFRFVSEDGNCKVYVSFLGFVVLKEGKKEMYRYVKSLSSIIWYDRLKPGTSWPVISRSAQSMTGKRKPDRND